MARDELLTPLIFRVVFQTRNINIFSIVEYAEVCVRGGKKPSPGLTPALVEARYQASTGRPLRLSYPQCLALLPLVEFKGFSRMADIQGFKDPDQGFRCLTDTQHDEHLRVVLGAYRYRGRRLRLLSQSWRWAPTYLNLYAWRSYHILELSTHDAAALGELKFQLGRAHHLRGAAKCTRQARERKDEARRELRREIELQGRERRRVRLQQQTG